MDEYLSSLGLSLELIGKKRMEESFYRWNAIYNEEGPAGVVGQRRGRPVDLKSASFKKLTYKEKAEFFEKDCERLRAENEIIKKLSALSIDRRSKPSELTK